MPRRPHERGELLAADLVGGGVDPPQDRALQAVECRGDGFVGVDHEHLDDLVRVGVVGRRDVDDAILVVEDQLHLGQVEFEHAGLDAAGLDLLCELRHRADQLDDLVVVPVGSAVADRLGVQVRQAGRRADERLGQSRRDDLRVRVVGDEDALAEARLAFLETADAVGENLRQHGHDAPGEVGARGAAAGHSVEGAALTDEVRHVGDVHAERDRPVAVRGQADRIVEVAGVGRVDRDHDLIGHILAPGAFGRVGRVEGLDGRPGVVHRGLGELILDPVRPDDRLRLDRGGAGLPERLDDHPRRQFAPMGILSDLDDDLRARLRTGGADVADDDRRVRLLAFRLDEPGPPRLGERADEAVLAPPEDLDDLPGIERLPVAATPLAGAGDHEVAAHRPARVLRRDEQVAVGVGRRGRDEAEPARVRPELAHDARGHLGQRQGVAFAEDDVPGVAEALDRLAERAVLRVGDAHLSRELARLEGLVVPPRKMFEYCVCVPFRHFASLCPRVRTLMRAIPRGLLVP